MEPSFTYYVYDKNNQVSEIRTKLMNHNPPLYVIQYPLPRKGPMDKISYRSEFVNEMKFYSKL